jgi:REP element-mobilizing transposase RayT
VAIAFFSTWTTYGSWLPGDDRGWFQAGGGWREPERIRAFEAGLRLTEDAVALDPERRRLVEQVVADHCAIRGWVFHAVNCRTNHVHVVVMAPDRLIEVPREQFKSWCSRRLKELERTRPTKRGATVREKWWTERGWDKYIDEEDDLADLMFYVLEGQTLPRAST